MQIAKAASMICFATVLSPAATLVFSQPGIASAPDLPYTVTHIHRTEPMSSMYASTSADWFVVPDLEAMNYRIPFTITIPPVDLPVGSVIESVRLNTDEGMRHDGIIGPREVLSVEPVQRWCPPDPAFAIPCPYSPADPMGMRAAWAFTQFGQLPTDEQLLQAVLLNQALVLNGWFELAPYEDFHGSFGFNAVTTTRYSGVFQGMQTTAYLALSVTTAPVPEPSAAVMFCIGTAVLVCIRWRTRYGMANSKHDSRRGY